MNMLVSQILAKRLDISYMLGKKNYYDLHLVDLSHTNTNLSNGKKENQPHGIDDKFKNGCDRLIGLKRNYLNGNNIPY